jgi:hypothetical protein
MLGHRKPTLSGGTRPSPQAGGVPVIRLSRDAGWRFNGCLKPAGQCHAGHLLGSAMLGTCCLVPSHTGGSSAARQWRRKTLLL